MFKRLKSSLNNTFTVSGLKTFDIVSKAEIMDQEVIRPLSNAYHKEGGVAVLWGSRAPDGAVVKQTAVSSNVMRFKGTARVFNSEEETMKAILGDEPDPLRLDGWPTGAGWS